MSFELQSVVYTALILMAVLMFQGGLVPRLQGFKWGLSSRDEPKEYSALQHRVSRTVANHLEGMAIYVPLILVAHLADVSTSLTTLGATLFVVGRALFAGFYIFGVPVARSGAWAISIAGIVLILIEVIKVF